MCHIFDQTPEEAFRRARIYSPKKHEEFLQRSIERAKNMDIEGIPYRPYSGKTDKDIAINYFKSLPKRVIKKLLGFKCREK